MRSNPTTLAKALRILSREIYCEDGVATAVIAEAADVIDRLRLTEAEREAVEFFGKMKWPTQSQQIKARAATLRGLLERHCPAPEKGVKQETTPPPHNTQSKCSVRTR